MCKHEYSFYYCGCDYFVWYDSVEMCGNRTLSGYSIDGYTIDMCDDKVATCCGYSSSYCAECADDHTLEYELDE